MARSNLKVFSGSAHPQLAQEIADFLCVAPGQARLQRFPDSEVSFQIDENIRGTDVFIVQPTSRPVDASIMELCVMIDAFRRSSASRITAVIPYYGYARQDRKDKPRVPISAKLVANLLSAAGANRTADDLHKAQFSVFRHPVDHVCRAIDHRNLARHNFPNCRCSPRSGVRSVSRYASDRGGSGNQRKRRSPKRARRGDERDWYCAAARRAPGRIIDTPAPS